MMAAWVSCSRIPPPAGVTILARFGASWVFCALTRFNGWKLIGPGGTEEVIAEPGEWWCKDAVINAADSAPQPSLEGHRLRRNRRPQQLSLCLASPDSGKLSLTAGEGKEAV